MSQVILGESRIEANLELVVEAVAAVKQLSQLKPNVPLFTALESAVSLALGRSRFDTDQIGSPFQ